MARAIQAPVAFAWRASDAIKREFSPIIGENSRLKLADRRNEGSRATGGRIQTSPRLSRSIAPLRYRRQPAPRARPHGAPPAPNAYRVA